MNLLQKLLEANSSKSSARFINLGGWLIASVCIVYDTVYNLRLSYEILVIYLAYCAGVYGINKTGGKNVQNRLSDKA